MSQPAQCERYKNRKANLAVSMKGFSPDIIPPHPPLSPLATQPNQLKTLHKIFQ